MGFGGFNQINYLPAMREGLVRALKKVGKPEYIRWADSLEILPVKNYVYGIGTVVLGAGFYKAHITEEYVKISDLVKTAEFCEKLVTAF